MERSFHVSSSTRSVLERGRELLNEYFEGEPFGWRDAGPSLSSLAEAHEVTLSAMYRCLSTSSVWIQCGEPELEHLTVSHLRELVVAARPARGELLKQAERERWNVARLRRACDKVRSQEPASRRGRPRRTPADDFVARAVRSWVSTPERLAGFDRLRHLSDDERSQLLRAVKTMQLELEMMRYRLEDGPSPRTR